MNEEQQQRFKSLWKQLEELDDAARANQLSKKNQYHSMISDIKSLSIGLSEAYKHYLDAKQRNAAVDFYDVFLDLLDKKVRVATILVTSWYEG